MSPLQRFFVFCAFAAWSGHTAAETATKSKSKTTSKTPAKSEPAAKPKTEAASKTQGAAKTETPARTEQEPGLPRPAAVSTMSIEDISDFSKYPKQVQSLVQSALALTHLELGYLYGSHEPKKGGMDCSGTVYHVLHFQGLKDVPRQSDEMCQWVEKKTQLHLTPTATNFDSPEFADLKPGDLLFWTNTTETKRKLPVTHVMIYLGKHQKNGKRIVFGASDGRSFEGLRRSGVSVFDFHLPRAESTTRFYGYGRAPGLLPPEPVPVVVAETKPVEPAPKVETPAPKPAPAQEEVRKAVAMVSETKTEPETKKTDTAAVTPSQPDPKKVIVVVPPAATDVEVKSAEPKPAAKPEVKKATAPTPSKTTVAKKKTTAAATRRTPSAPPKTGFERTMDNAVNSVRRFFRQ